MGPQLGGSWVETVPKSEITALYSDMGSDAKIIVNHVDNASKWYIHAVSPTLTSYLSGRVVLVGDAVCIFLRLSSTYESNHVTAGPWNAATSWGGRWAGVRRCLCSLSLTGSPGNQVIKSQCGLNVLSSLKSALNIHIDCTQGVR